MALSGFIGSLRPQFRADRYSAGVELVETTAVPLRRGFKRKLREEFPAG